MFLLNPQKPTRQPLNINYCTVLTVRSLCISPEEEGTSLTMGTTGEKSHLDVNVKLLNFLVTVVLSCNFSFLRGFTCRLEYLATITKMKPRNYYSLFEPLFEKQEKCVALCVLWPTKCTLLVNLLPTSRNWFVRAAGGNNCNNGVGYRNKNHITCRNHHNM